MRRLVALTLVLAACLSSARADALPVEFRPYRVTVSIAFERSPELVAATRADLLEDLRGLIARTFGEAWTADVREAEPGAVFDAATLSAWTPTDVPIARTPPPDGGPPLPGDAAPDKLLAVGVSADGPAFVVAAREWDRVSDSLGPVGRTRTVAADGLPVAVLRAMRQAFRAVARVETSKDDAATLSVQAGGIPTPDPTARPDVRLFRPVLRRLDRDGRLVEIRPVPWTLVERQPRKAEPPAWAVRSALRSGLGGLRGTVEAWAVAATPSADSTRLTLVRRRDGVPLAGRIVEVRSSPFPVKDEPPLSSLLSDRSGTVTVPAGSSRLVWVPVKSGDVPLLRLPLSPGVEPAATAELGDDPARLDAEGRIAVLSGELIEAVAKRATLLAKARSSARTDKFAEAEAALAAAAELPGAESFRARLSAIEAPAAKSAEDAGDRVSAARIRALSRKTTALIDRYLAADPVRATREEVAELKAAAARER